MTNMEAGHEHGAVQWKPNGQGGAAGESYPWGAAVCWQESS
jgi:hypothetical protein